MSKNRFNHDAKLASQFKEYAKSLNILFVEDDDKLRKNLENTLSHVFKNVYSAGNGLEALALYEENGCDLVLTDINMPEMNGIELIEELRKKDKELPIVVLSAHNESQYYIELINLGVDGFVLKPMNLLNLMYTLTRSCKALYNIRKLKKLEHDVIAEQNRTIVMAKSIEDGEKISKEKMRLLRTSYNSISARDYVENYPVDLEIFSDKLEHFEENLDIHIGRLFKKPSLSNRDLVVLEFSEIGSLISTLPEFSNMAIAVEDFAKTLGDVEDLSNIGDIEDLLFNVSESLYKWRTSIFVDMSTDNIHYLDASLINDCIQLESVLKGEELLDGGDMEFF